MRERTSRVLFLCLILNFFPALLTSFDIRTQAALAQTTGAVTSDNSTNTISTKTTVSNGNASIPHFNITEGTIRTAGSAATLFHSFDTFSPANSSVTFDLRDAQNTVDTQFVNLIISRVTGDSISFIDGELSILQDVIADTAPDLFVLNPNGIVFGANAQLSLPGSLLASTASDVIFKEGVFSSADLNQPPMLTVSAPIGLQITRHIHSEGITVQGNGHRIATADPILQPYLQPGNTAGLSLSAGNALALVGNSIDIEGGALNAPSGSIEIGAVDEGRVSLEWKEGTPLFLYDSVEQFGDASLKKAGLVNVSGDVFGTPSGYIQLQGRDVSISEGALLWSQNRGLTSGGDITIEASNRLAVSGNTAPGALRGVITETVAPGEAGSVTVSAGELAVAASGVIISRTYSAGNGGDLKFSADSVEVTGEASLDPSIFSTVGTLSLSAGEAGDVVGHTGDLAILNGGYLGSTTFGVGNGGDVVLRSEDVVVKGISPIGTNSLISSTTVGAGGRSGNIDMDVRSLTIQDSGLVTTASIGTGNAGNLNVTATEFIDISGYVPGSFRSSISSRVDRPSVSLQQALSLSGISRGSAGSVEITTPLLNISNNGSVTVANLVEGDAGTLTINANTIDVENASIDAFAATGNGGNIALSIQDNLLLKNGQIRAAAGENGNGGNISIQSPVVFGVEDSNIVANAIAGNGGNIDIVTQEIFGLAFSAQQTPESDITASSEFGVSGTVSIDGFGTSVDAGLSYLPSEMSDESDRIVSSCGPLQSNQFISSGRGGLSLSPTNNLVIAQPWQDLRERSIARNVQSSSDRAYPDVSAAQTLVEASRFTAIDGNIVLIADSDRAAIVPQADCLQKRA